MEQNQKDILIAKDEKSGEIGVVTGLQNDGTPKITDAKPKNAQDFLKFDKHGDVLDNFFANFFRQYKEPNRFGFYRVAADGAENAGNHVKVFGSKTLAPGIYFCKLESENYTGVIKIFKTN